MNVEAYLKSLGDSPEQVVNSLEALGITGRRHRCSDCIIARALQKRFNEAWEVYAFDACLVVDCRTKQIAKLPEPVLDVRRKFDLGQLPQFDETLTSEYQI